MEVPSTDSASSLTVAMDGLGECWQKHMSKDVAWPNSYVCNIFVWNCKLYLLKILETLSARENWSAVHARCQATDSILDV